MAKEAQTLPRWRIIRLKATPAATIGSVEAPDRETAIKEAIRKYDIPANHQPKLMAYRVA